MFFNYIYIKGINVAMSRILAIDSPPTFKMKFVYWYSKRLFGRVLETLKIIYVRRPKLFPPYLRLLNSLERGIELDKNIITLIKAHISTLNGCEFCIDIAIRTSQKDNTLIKQIGSLPNIVGNTLFSPREQAILSYVQDATINRKVTSEIFEELKKYCSENEILDITWLNAAENFLNLTTLPLDISASEYCEIYSELKNSSGA